MQVTESVKPERILKDLAKLWADLAKDDGQPGSSGVLRACAMTLIAAVEQEADAAAVGETLAELMHQHPSRAIVLRVCPEQQSALDARVSAQCWMPFGRRQQICCEQIEITASPSRVEDLPKLVLGLTVPDLPVVLWCRTERLAEDANFQQLFPLADKIIIDTTSFSDPSGGRAYLRRLQSEGRLAADLAWTRLTRWREMITHIFDSDRAQERLKDIEKITIAYNGEFDARNLPSSLAYLGAWTRSVLAVDENLRSEPALDMPDRKIRRVSFRAPGFEACVEREGREFAIVRVDQLTQRVPYPQLSDYDLMREELSILGLDPIFRRCLG